jgi:hypothetical protein
MIINWLIKMMELTEDFLKLLQIAFLVVGVLSIFFIYINYSFTVASNDAEREVFMLGNSLLSSECLTVIRNGELMKALFSQNKLDTLDPSCIKYPNGKVNITLLDYSRSWKIIFSTPTKNKEAKFYVVVKLDSGDIVPAEMVVSI